MNSGLPNSWSVCRLGEIVDVVGGGTPSKSKPNFWIDGTIPWVSPKDMKAEVITDSEDHITSEGLLGSSTNLIPKGSVLVVTRSGILASALPIAITGVDVTINQDLKALIPRDGIDPEYIAFVLKRFAAKILRECSKSGTTVQSILTSKLLQFEVPLAPSAEQRRINERVKTALSHVENARSAVKGVSAGLELYRSLAMSCAFSGQATAKWRQSNADLVGHEDDSKIKNAKNDFGYSETKSIFGIGADVPWNTATLDSICERERAITYGIIQTGEATDNGVPTVRAGDIKNFQIDVSSLKKVRPDIAAQYPRTRLRGGEVLVSIRGTTGNVAIAPPNMAGMNVSREVAIIPVSEVINARFVAYALASPAGQGVINANIKGIAQSGINLSDLRTFSVPLPGLPEQQIIIEFIEEAFAKMDRLEDHRAGILCALDELSKAVLVKAFVGDLATQSEDDEPSELLLKRIENSSAKRDITKRRRPPATEKRKVTRRATVAQTRSDVSGSHLQDILASASTASMPVRELYLRAEMDVDEFYKQLALEIESGKLRQTADKSRLELNNAP